MRFIEKSNGDQPFKPQVDLMESPISAGDSFEFESSPVFPYAGPSGLYLVCPTGFLLDISDHTAREKEESMVKPVPSVILFLQISIFLRIS